MSDLESKLAAPLPASVGAAKQNLGQLKKRWGSPRYVEGVPAELEIAGMGRERWVRMDDGSRGESTNYTLEGSK